MDKITLTGCGYEAVICPRRGANLISLSRSGLHACSLRTPADDGAFSDAPFFWGTPLLFPPNRIRDFTFEGRRYTFPAAEGECFIHGTLHREPFRVTDRQKTAVTLCYEATVDRPYLSFPHAFAVIMVYRLTGEGLFQTVSVENRSPENMPVALGYHTTFALPGGPERAGVTLALDCTCEISRGADYLPTGEIMTDSPVLRKLQSGTLHPAEEALSVHLKMGGTRQMILTDPASGTRVIYRPDAGFGYWMLFGGGDRDFVCVEPQTQMINAPGAPFDRAETGFRFLRPGETGSYTTALSIEKANT